MKVPKSVYCPPRAGFLGERLDSPQIDPPRNRVEEPDTFTRLLGLLREGRLEGVRDAFQLA